MNILIVDDEEDVLFSLKKGLEYINDDLKIYTANNGEKCFEILSDELPDLILLDLMMPNMNGWQVLDVIQENNTWRDIPIFIITAAGNPEFKETAQNLGITYIEKPISISELNDTINHFFDMI